LTIKGSGTGISGTADFCHFVYQKLIDNGTVSAQLITLDNASTTAQAGLMIRDSLDQVSRTVFWGMSKTEGLVFAVRDTLSKNMKVITVIPTSNTTPCWLKLTREDNEFTAWYSTDRQNWIVAGTTTVKMNRMSYAGIGVSSKNQNYLTTVLVDKATVKQDNIRPVAKLSNPFNGKTPYVIPAIIHITGTAYDLDGALDKAEIYLNDSLCFSTNNTAFSYDFSTSKTGSYKLYVKAYDNDGSLQTSDTVQFLVNETSTKIPYYKFDETKTGYFAYDASGNNMTAVLYNGPTVTSGKQNYAILLDGMDDYVKMPNGFIEKLSDFTISIWVYLKAQSTWSRIFDFGSGTTAYMFLTPYNGSVMKFAILSQDGRSQEVAANMALPVDAWHHIALTVGSDKAVLYLDGTVVGSTLSFKLRPYDIGSTTQNYMGKSQFSSDPYLSGMLDEFRVFNYALTEAEVKDLMLATAIDQVKTKELLDYPKLVEGYLVLANKANTVITVFDMTGKKVLNKTCTDQNSSINLTGLAAGIYIVQYMDVDNQVRQNKLIVKK
jgi:hypothetical protein